MSAARVERPARKEAHRSSLASPAPRCDRWRGRRNPLPPSDEFVEHVVDLVTRPGRVSDSIAVELGGKSVTAMPSMREFGINYAIGAGTPRNARDRG